MTGQFLQALGDQRGGLGDITATRRDPRAQEGARLLDAGGDRVRQRVAVRGAGGVNGAAPLAALGRLEVQRPGDPDDLAIHGDDAGIGGDLADGQANSLPCRSPA